MLNKSSGTRPRSAQQRQRSATPTVGGRPLYRLASRCRPLHALLYLGIRPTRLGPSILPRLSQRSTIAILARIISANSHVSAHLTLAWINSAYSVPHLGRYPTPSPSQAFTPPHTTPATTPAHIATKPASEPASDRALKLVTDCATETCLLLPGISCARPLRCLALAQHSRTCVLPSQTFTAIRLSPSPCAPVSLNLIRCLLVGAPLGGSLAGSLGGLVGVSLGGPVGPSLSDSIGASFGAPVGGLVDGPVSGSVAGSVGGPPGSSLGGPVDGSLCSPTSISTVFEGPTFAANRRFNHDVAPTHHPSRPTRYLVFSPAPVVVPTHHESVDSKARPNSTTEIGVPSSRADTKSIGFQVPSNSIGVPSNPSITPTPTPGSPQLHRPHDPKPTQATITTSPTPSNRNQQPPQTPRMVPIPPDEPRRTGRAAVELTRRLECDNNFRNRPLHAPTTASISPSPNATIPHMVAFDIPPPETTRRRGHPRQPGDHILEPRHPSKLRGGINR